MRSDAKYQVSVRGPVPADLQQKIAEAHALAIQGKSTRTDLGGL